MPPNENTSPAGRWHEEENCQMSPDDMTPDDCIELGLARMTAMPPLGGVGRVVWGRASVLDEHAGMIAEVRGQLSVYIEHELRKRGISPDTGMLSALAEITATAMIQQHEFTELITNRSCLLGLFRSRCAAAEAVRKNKWEARMT